MLKRSASAATAVSAARRRYIVLAAGLSAALLGACALATSAAAVAPGWAPRGHPSLPNTQHLADDALARTPAECGPNAIILFRVRGSGEGYQRDRLGTWTHLAGDQLIRQGWRVRDLQARYSAPEVPIVRAVVSGLLTRGVGAFTTMKRYRDVATREWRGVYGELVAAAGRCPQRKIAIAGYSQGAIILRYVVPRLPRSVQQRIVAVDLFADPTADTRVDKNTSSLRGNDARRSTGLDTSAARATNPWFKQTPYPDTVAGVAVQYCVKDDVVCDTPGNGGSITDWGAASAIHGSYGFGISGLLTARRIGNPPRQGGSGGNPPVSDVSAGPPVIGGTPPPTGAPRPYAGNLTAVNHGGGHVGVAFDVGWQAGRDPVVCRFYRNGIEVFAAQCGTRSSKQFYGLPAGRHTFHATVTDRFGIVSAPTNSVTVTVASAPAPAPASNRLSNDGRLSAASNQSLVSADGRYRFVMQSDSNLVLYGPSGRALWTTSTVGRGANHLRMQGDGNLVMYNGANAPIWSSNTPRHYSAYLIVQNDGNVVIYNGTQPIWSTGTAGRT